MYYNSLDYLQSTIIVIRLIKFIPCLAVFLIVATVAFAQSAFPTKPLLILGTSGAGANLDVHTRNVAEQMSKQLGQTIFVDNVTGAGGLLALRQIARQTAADGYTRNRGELMLGGVATARRSTHER